MPNIEYDAVIPLGMNCAMATQLKWRGLRQASFPFDWLLFQEDDALESIVTLLETRFENFLNKDYLVDEESRIRTRILVTNTFFHIQFPHDFLQTIDENELANVKAKYARRIDRLYDTIKQSDTVCLAISGKKGFLELTKINATYERIRKLFPTTKIDLYIVSFEDDSNTREEVPLNGGTLYLEHLIRPLNTYDVNEKTWEFSWLNSVSLTSKFVSSISGARVTNRKISFVERIHYKIYHHTRKWLDKHNVLRLRYDD